MTAAPILHVGHHKTASSWLSRHLFGAKEQGFETLLSGREEVWPLLVRPNCLDFDAERVRAAVAPGMRAATETGRVPAISWQRLSGHPDSGGFDAAILARRLHAVFPDARILIVIREQRRVLRSVYGQYFRTAGPLALRRYLHPTDEGETRLPAFDPAYWEYDRLAFLYRDLFGPGRVLVLPFEWFVDEPWAFVEAIRSFAGARPVSPPAPPFRAKRNVSFSALCGELAIRWNRLTADDRIHRGALWPDARLNRFGLRGLFKLDELLLKRLAGPVERRWRAEIERFCRGRYEESNRRVAGIVGRSLEGYGYAGVDESKRRESPRPEPRP